MATLATSRFERYLHNGGTAITGASVWIVPQADTYPTNAMALTEDGSRSGVYYRDAVGDGEYKIYYDTGAGVTLYGEKYYHGESRLTTIADHFDSADSFRLKTTGIKDDAVDKTKIAVDVAGSGLAQDIDGSLKADVDNSTVEVDAGTNKILVKDGGITAAKIATDAVTNPKIQAGAIDDAKVASGANIAANKLAKGTQGQILVTYLDDTGAPFTEPRWVTVGGDATYDAYGNVTISNAAITAPKIAADAVDKTKINADVAGSGIAQDTDGSLKADVDNTTIEINVTTDKLQVKSQGITSAKLNPDVYGAGIKASEIGAIDADVDNTTIEIDITTDKLQVKDGGITNAKISAGTIAIDRVDADFTKKMYAGIAAVSKLSDLPSDFLQVINIEAMNYACNDLINFTADGQKI